MLLDGVDFIFYVKLFVNNHKLSMRAYKIQLAKII